MNRSQQLLRPFGLGASLPAGIEFQDWKFTASGSPAPAVYGRVDGTFRCSTATLNATSGLPTAAAALSTFESIWGTGNVEASSVNKGYRLKFVGDLNGYDIEEATLTPSTTYVLNTGTSTPRKTSQRDYSAGVQEVITITMEPTDVNSDGFVQATSGPTVNYVGSNMTYNSSGYSGWTILSGDGTGTVQFQKDGVGPQNTSTLPLMSSNSNSSTPIIVNTAGQAEQPGRCVIGITAGAVGYATFADGFTALPFSIADTGANIKSLLNGVDGYNASKVDTVTVGASTITIDYATGESPVGTITIDGKTGAAVTATLTTVQNGANFDPLTLPWDVFFDPNHDYYKDNGTTLAAAGETVQFAKNRMNAGAALNLSQPDGTHRMTYRVSANGEAYLESADNGKYYDGILIPCTAGFCTIHLIAFTANGYYNLFEDSGLASPNCWVNPSAGIEPNEGVAGSLSSYNDGQPHVLMTYTGPTGNARTKVWVDGTLLINVASKSVGTNRTINQFNRGNGTGWKGKVGRYAHGSFDPSTYAADLAAWFLANAFN